MLMCTARGFLNQLEKAGGRKEYCVEGKSNRHPDALFRFHLRHEAYRDMTCDTFSSLWLANERCAD